MPNEIACVLIRELLEALFLVVCYASEFVDQGDRI